MNAKFRISSAAEATNVIAGLARANNDETCAAVLQILAGLQASALAPRTLLEITEILRPPGHDVIAAYRTGYTDRALPLGAEETRRFGQAMALLRAFETLYQRAFEAALAAPPNDPVRKDLASALQRCMACLVDQMIERYRARQSVGLESWKRLQQHMQTARREKLEVAQVPDSLNPRGAATPLATYARALLLSIAQAGAMEHRDLEASLALTGLFADLVDVTMLDNKGGEGSSGPQGGVAGVGIQRTGRIRVVSVGGVTHLVNTTRLAGALNWCLQRLRDGDTPEQIGLATVAQADLAGLLPRLHRIWCGGGEIRETARQPLREQSAVAVGFREIHQFGSAKPLVVPKEFEVYQADPAAFRSKDAQAVPNPAEDWQILDHSASGIRAQRPQPGARLRRTQLLGVRFDSMRGGSRFALGEVRWLQQLADSEGAGIAAGVRFVSMHAQVALVRAFGLTRGHFQEVQPAFVLEGSSPPQLVLPSGWFAPRRKVDLWYQDMLSNVELTDLRARGADYEIAGYETIK